MTAPARRWSRTNDVDHLYLAPDVRAGDRRLESRSSSYTAPEQMASLEAGSISDGSPANAWTPHRRAPSHVEHATPRHHEGAPSHERPHKTPALPAPAPRHKHHLHAEIVKLGHRGKKREPGPNQIVGPHDFSAHLAGGLAALPTATKSGHAGREALGHRDKSSVLTAQ